MVLFGVEIVLFNMMIENGNLDLKEFVVNLGIGLEVRGFGRILMVEEMKKKFYIILKVIELMKNEIVSLKMYVLE